MNTFERDGFALFAPDASSLAWAGAAHHAGLSALADEKLRSNWLRHGGTWFVGVDALPNETDGSLASVPLDGPWRDHVALPKAWHRAQLSVVFPGYPRQDPTESEAAHRFRINRCAAHVDGLHLEAGRRFLREPHRFILGIALNESDGAPLVVWPGSHRRMRAAFQAVLKGRDPLHVDLTEAYKAARARVFEDMAPMPVPLLRGASILLHRHLLHGIAPWTDGAKAPPEGRMTAYFRPQFDDLNDWL